MSRPKLLSEELKNPTQYQIETGILEERKEKVQKFIESNKDLIIDLVDLINGIAGSYVSYTSSIVKPNIDCTEEEKERYEISSKEEFDKHHSQKTVELLENILKNPTKLI